MIIQKYGLVAVKQLLLLMMTVVLTFLFGMTLMTSAHAATGDTGTFLGSQTGLTTGSVGKSNTGTLEDQLASLPDDPSTPSAGGVDLAGSGVVFNPNIPNQSSYYPNDVINLMLQAFVQKGQTYTNGTAKIYLDKTIFNKVAVDDISGGESIKGTPSVSETAANYVVTIPLNTVTNSTRVGIPFLASLKPGKVVNGGTYKITTEFFDNSGTSLYKTDTFSVTGKTDNIFAYSPGTETSLDEKYFDSGNNLKNDTTISVGGGLGYHGDSDSNHYFYIDKSQPGEYTFKVNLPAGYHVPDGGAGSWQYDKLNNVLTKKMTVDTTGATKTRTGVDLGSFQLIVPRGYHAGSHQNISMDVNGPNGRVDVTNYYIAIDKTTVDPPDPKKLFFIWPAKIISREDGKNASHMEISSVTDKTVFNSELNPMWRMGGDQIDGVDVKAVSLQSITDSPDTGLLTNKVSFGPMDGMNGNQIGALENNNVEGTYDENGKSVTTNLGKVKFYEPLTIPDRQYTSIKVNFNSPVTFQKSQQDMFKVFMSGHLTKAVLDDFNNSTSTNKQIQNQMDAQFVKTKDSIYDDPEHSSSNIGLYKDAPRVSGTGLSLAGKNGNQLLGKGTLLASFGLRVDDNDNLQIILKMAKWCLSFQMVSQLIKIN
ncbi:hypothetical protein [Lentilactobacillus kisonensis]|uniref:WxL domain-containing protein n=1 Tax=Lentilactobacillus kisonensis F0435 TaxID=797516 RepID=H1LDS8_9LACO|nr:hypothetical protein [Lentilactobacillus kisonensis]EHO53049.1 hypothetical protein HMPREF9104_00753 [Lentilactobacillus kisonensis F0435]